MMENPELWELCMKHGAILAKRTGIAQNAILSMYDEMSYLFCRTTDQTARIAELESEVEKWRETAYRYAGLRNERAEKAEATVRELYRIRDKLRGALGEVVMRYGQPGGPWYAPAEPGSWITLAREALEYATTTEANNA